METFGLNLAHIPELDLMGAAVRSPDGNFALVMGHNSHAGRDASAGSYASIRDGELHALGSAERPTQGAIADTGDFVINDWLDREELVGRFLAVRSDGRIAVDRRFSANLNGLAISPDGRHGVCQTLNSPGSDDSGIVALFDLDEGTELSRFQPLCGTAHDFAFDVANASLSVIGRDGDSETYSFDGRPLNREEWTWGRIDRGDLIVTGDMLKSINGAPAPDITARVRRGLALMASTGEAWQQACALRLDGKLCEMAGDEKAAIVSYDRALSIDPQVGVLRRLEQLRRKADPKFKSTRIGRHQRQAERLGINHEVLQLDCGGPELWRLPGAGIYASVEEAALAHYGLQGWSGAAAEGGLVLTLLRAASFDALPPRFADTFIEAIYARNVAWPMDRFESEDLIGAIGSATLQRIERNWTVICATAGDTPAFYPRVRREHVMQLFSVLGVNRLGLIARLFASSPYDLRAGWPDLTLWRDDQVRFVEVKSPTDQTHASQARLISTILVPLGFHVTLAEARAEG